MILLFWICTILLALGVVGAWVRPQPWYPQATGVLVVIDLVILGLHVLGAPH